MTEVKVENSFFLFFGSFYRSEWERNDFVLYSRLLADNYLLSFRALFGGLRGGSFTYAQARIDRRIRDHLFKSLVKQEIGFFDQNKTGEIPAISFHVLNTLSFFFFRRLKIFCNFLSWMIQIFYGQQRKTVFKNYNVSS